MKKDILLTLKDAHTIDGSREAYEMTTHGTFDGDDNNYTIEYDEQYDDLQGCHTVLTVTERRCVSIVRSGSYNTELMIERGKRHNCEYATPHGSFLIGISAQKVKSTVTDGKGTLELRYTIDFYGGVASENEMIITLE